jgi:DNA-directed RNA polymerase subunit RPC12/RpoP
LKFLGRAKKFLQDLGTETPAKVQYFNVTCASGHRVRGERTEGYQAIRCPACGDGVFILPRSPLPEPAAPPREARTRREAAWPGDGFVDEGPVELTDLPRAGVELADRQLGQGEVEIIWDDEPAAPASRRDSSSAPAAVPDDAPEAEPDAATDEDDRRIAARAADPASPPQRSREKPADRTGPPAPGSQPERTASPAGGSTGQRRRESSPRPSATVARQANTRPALESKPPAIPEPHVAPRRRSHLGLIVLLLPLLIIATIGWSVWRQRRQDSPLIAEKGRLEGIPALDAGEFDKAYQLLSAARTAVDALGGDVEDAEEIRHAAEEAAIFVDLCNDKLEDMLAEAARPEPEPGTWASNFDRIYKGRAYIFDTTITAVPPDGSTDGYEVEYLVVPPGESSRFGDGVVARPDRFARIDLTGFELFQQARPSKGDAVKFGCRLAAMRFDTEKNYWVVQLMPKGGVFLRHPRALEVVGGPRPDLIDVPQEAGQP